MKKQSRKLRHASLPKDISTSPLMKHLIYARNGYKIFALLFKIKEHTIYSDIINDPNESMNGRWTADWTIKKLDKVVGADGWHRINSVGTDTCNTMRDTWNRMARDPRAKHVFFIPCDSHGLQLLMKEIIETTWFSDRFQSAQNVVTHFNKSPKQLTLLREKMCNAYNGKKRAFILSVLTRWGTQVNMIEQSSGTTGLVWR